MITYTSSTGCRDTALVMINACARPAGSIVGEGVGNIRVVPNPNAGTFTISGQLAQTNDEQLLIEVTNMLGQVVHGNTLAMEGAIYAQVQLGENIAIGMYLLTVKSIKEVRVFHIVVEQ